jgi:AraC-like DNA-binding protein
MTARHAFDRDTYAEDIAALRRRNWTWDRIARHLGMSLATLKRIRQETSR